jgi:rhomboid protease GluP
MTERDLTAPPMNPLPPLIWLVLLAMALIEAVLWLAGQGFVGGPQGLGWRMEVIQRFAFSAEVQAWMLETHRAPVDHLWRYISFSFLHGQPAQAALSLVLLAAMGKFVGERLGTVRLAVLLVVPPIVGAAVFGLVMASDPLGWLFGALPMVFSLIGAFTFLRWQGATTQQEARKAFSLIVVLMLARLAMGFMVEAGSGWIADLVAFALGFALTASMQRRIWQSLRRG